MMDSILLKIPVPIHQTSPLLTKKKLKTGKGRVQIVTFSEDKNNKHKKEGYYKPYIYLESQTRIIEEKYVCVQVSLPKFLFGNSLFEVQESLLNQVVRDIHKLLGEYQIYVSPSQIREGWICRADFAKIVILPRRYTNARDFIEKLEKGGFRPRSDLTKRDIRHGKDGYWIKFYNSTSSVTVYDKMSEIANQGYTKSEKVLSKHLQQNKLTRNILKFEVSLQSTQKVTNTLNKLLKRQQGRYTLQGVFSKDVSQKVLLHYLDSSFNNEVDFLCECFNEQEIRTQIRNLYGYKKTKVYLYFILREMEVRGANIVLEEIKTMHGYQYRRGIQQDIKKLQEALLKAKKQKISPVAFLKDYIEKFKLHTPTSR